MSAEKGVPNDAEDRGEEFADDSELFAAVGRVVACGASLEWTIVELHATLLHSPRGLSAVAGEGFDRARSGCNDLARLVGEPLDAIVVDVTARAGAAWVRRNAVVHGAWLGGSYSGVPGRSGLTMRLRKTGLITERWSVDSLSALMEDLTNAVDGINAIVRRLEDPGDLRPLLDRKVEPWTISPVDG